MDFKKIEKANVSVEKFRALRERAHKEVDEGLLRAAQCAVAKDGEVIWHESFGDATNNSLFPVFSSTKAIMSAAAWLVIQDGQLDIEEVVADIVPEFATNDKETIKVVQLFLHTSGFPMAPFRPIEWNDRPSRLGRFAKWRLNWEPGSKFEYHPTSSMWVIAEIVERKTGMDFRDFIRQRISEPLGLKDFYVGLPDKENHRVTQLEHVGEGLTSEDYARLGMPEPPVTEVTEEAILAFNHPAVRAVGVPGGGGIMTAAAMTLFYQGLLHGSAKGGETVWTRDTLDYALNVISGDYVDPLMGHPINRALGVVIAGDEKRNLRGFGHTNSPQAFGHGGAGGQVAWADPATGLSFCYLTNCHDRNPIRMGARGVSLSNRAASLIEH
ncbi:MAG: beta-lactamase family protein [Gammaproteobacteria bacterium]|nr:beta-lactamase family protein [Gammaproteobacteria bacterium]